jgi:hypothetical protein
LSYIPCHPMMTIAFWFIHSFLNATWYKSRTRQSPASLWTLAHGMPDRYFSLFYPPHEKNCRVLLNSIPPAEKPQLRQSRLIFIMQIGPVDGGKDCFYRSHTGIFIQSGAEYGDAFCGFYLNKS